MNEKIWETASIPGSFMNTSGQYFSLNMTNVPASKKEPPIGDEIHLSIWLSLIVLLVSLVLICTFKRILSPIERSSEGLVELPSLYSETLESLGDQTKSELKKRELQDRFDTFHKEIPQTALKKVGKN